MSGIVLTPANVNDAQVLPELLPAEVRIAVGDGAYNARVMRERLWKERGIFVLAPPHPKQKTKLVVCWQLLLLKLRPRIEAVFDELKEHFPLVTSFPRSVEGYLLHYLMVITGYQLLKLSG